MCFAEKIALVTGAASGIGKAVVTELAQRKACVFAADIDTERVRTLAAQLDNTTPLTLDVTDEADWQAAFQAIDHLDIFISAAGISHAKATVEMSLEEWRRVMAVNLDGAFLGIRSTLRTMIPRRRAALYSSLLLPASRRLPELAPTAPVKQAFACWPKRLRWSARSMGFE
jgi:NAD(P)-dependent dehydrogenase (short-subunit alcohol dehydrogenase family)